MQDQRPRENNPYHSQQKPRSRVFLAFAILLSLLVLGYLISSFFDDPANFEEESDDGSKEIALIKVYGEIVSSSDDSFFSTSGADSSSIVSLIEQAESDPKVAGILVEINSPGGAPVASLDIVEALRKSTKPTASLIKDIGASGGYWVASSTDYVVASPISITGSVGVLGSYVEYAGLMDKYNVTYRKLTGGKYKDIGTPFREMSPEEQAIMQKKIDLLHSYFLDSVKDFRSLSDEQVKTISTGEIFIGSEALKLNLIDDTGNMENIKAYFEDVTNSTVTFKEFSEDVSFFKMLFGTISGQVATLGYGIGKGITAEDKYSVKI